MRDGWTEISISDLLEVSIGGVWGGDPGTDEIDVCVYRQTEFDDNGTLSMPSDAVRSITENQLKSRTLQPGDILMQKSAGTPTLPGRVVIVPSEIERNATCSNFLHLLRADSAKCGSHFLFWFLWFNHQSGRAFEFQRGTNIKNLDLNQYLAQQVLLPPLAEQKRIVDVVSSVDAYIDALQQQSDSAHTARNAVLHELLSAGGDGWTETTLGDVVTINPEAVKGLSQDAEIVYVDLSSVSAESGISADLYRGAFGEAPGRARRVIRSQDVLVSTVRPYLKGFVLVPANLDGEIASTGFAVLRANPKKVLSGFIWATVGLNNFVDYLMDRATGSSYPAVRPDDVASFELSLPPLVEQKRIVDILSSMDVLIQSTEQAVVDAKNLRSSLLSDLLSGEHEIPASYDSFLGAA
jgi:type I restriction enzyme S subunit